MKIGIDIRLIGKKRTGDEAVFFNLVKNLAKTDAVNDYFLFTDIIDAESLKSLKERLEIKEKKNFKIVSLLAANKFIWNFWTLPKYLQKNPLDIYETQYITPFFVSKKIKIVTIIHDISFNFFPQFIKFLDLLFLKILIPISLKRADAVVAVSKFTKNEIIKYYKIPEGKIFVIYNALAEEFLTADIDENKLEKVKIKYNLPDKFILYLGTLQPRKNIPHLISAFSRIKKRLPELSLVIGGNKQAYNFDRNIDAVLKKTGLRKEVHFTGFIDEEDKKAVFQLSSVFVFPSLYEGFGIPLLEAMSQSAPIIASNIESLKEIGKEAAIYINPVSLDEFESALYNICVSENLRKELIQKGKERVSFFSWEKSARETLAVYEKILHN
jgi:glycosyltransferase involved in cell wall biosynthesis